MSVAENLHPTRILPEAMAEGLKRWAIRSAGLGLVLVAVAGWLSLASWSIHDPSWNNLTSTAPRNLLGFGGAILADILFQAVGLAAIFVFLPLASWGWRLMALSFPDQMRWRLLLWPVALVLLAGTLSGLTPPASWPLPGGLGGIAGDYLMGAILGLGNLMGWDPLVGRIVSAFALPATGVWALLGASTLTLRDLALIFQLGPKTADPVVTQATESQQPEADAPQPAATPQAPIPVVMETVMGATQSGEAVDPVAGPHVEIIREREPAPEPVQPTPMAQAGAPTSKAPTAETAVTPVQPTSMPQAQQLAQGATPPAARVKVVGAVVDPSGRIEPHFGETDLLLNPAAAPTPTPVQPTTPAPTPAPGAEAYGPHLPPQQAEGASGTARPVYGYGYGRLKRVFSRRKVIREQQLSLLSMPGNFALPPVDFLQSPPKDAAGGPLSHDVLQDNARQLKQVLQDFGIKGEIINIRPGPVVTLYELEPARGVKSARVISLADDIARSMSAVSARIAVIPGRNAIGIELPNKKRQMVYLRDLIESKEAEMTGHALPLLLGKNIGGRPVIVDLAAMPHLLIAGTTGSGKSVGINTMILSLLYRLPPDKCKFIMIDPKMLELSAYDGIPHLLAPVVTDPKKAVLALKWTVREMEERYKKMSKLGVRNIDGFNEKVEAARARGETIKRTVQTGFDPETGEAIYEQEILDYEPMPRIVVVVDEMADLMLVAGKDIEGAVQRLAQMARAAGIHLITATQRPSVDVITGTIKANFPTRISFQVTSKVDSRTILGEIGAEQLLGAGDMLYMAGGGRISRIHGAYVSDEEVEKVANYLKAQGVPQYLDAVTEAPETPEEKPAEAPEKDKNERLYDEAVAIVLRDKKASTSYIQRRLSIGYNRAATLIERMEAEGIISQANSAGKREILIDSDHVETLH